MNVSESSVQEIPKWVRRYAQNRTAPVLIWMVCFILLSVGIGGSSYLGGMAYRGGRHGLFGVSLAVLILSCGATIWFSIPKWGGQWIQRLGERYYAPEGEIELTCPKKPPRGARAYVIVFVLCQVAAIAAGLMGWLSMRYFQPVTALYFVPFATLVVLLERPRIGYIALLWPALYAIHAILVVAGAPIVFEGRAEALNVAIPMMGYGILTAIIGHIYNRYALWRLKRLAG
jgi:hypothetical protein